MPYMVQEYLTGEDLTEKIARRDLSVKVRAGYLLRIAQGLAYAHDHSVVHRDIKPGNLRITDDGQLRILDFGIARLLDQTRPFTTDGVTLGTVGYMAPELLSDDEVDWRCDIFSYGVVAYELLSYSLPFQGDTFVRISYRLLNEEPPSLAEAAPDCPPALIQLVERCLRKRREDRYTTFHQVVEELSRLLDDTGVQPSASPSTDNAPVLAVSGGAPTTPVPQAAVAPATTAPTPASSSIPASVPTPTPTSGPSPSAPPTAPMEGRGGFGVRHMAGLVGLGLVAVLVFMLLPGAVQEPTSPAPTPDPAVHQETALGESAVAAPTAESTAAPDEHSPSDPAGVQGAAPSGLGEMGAKQHVTVSSGSERLSANDVPDNRQALSETADRAPSVANEPRDGSSGIQPEAIEPPSETVDPSPNRQAAVDASAVDAPSTLSGAAEPSDPSLDAGADDSVETKSSPVPAVASATVPAQPQTENVVADAPSDPGVTAPPSVPAEVVPPRLLEQVQPEYPSRARRRRLEATVTVVVWVEADGSVERTTVKSVSARGMGFEDAAKAAARKSRFAPGTEDGTPKAMWTEMVFQFRLSG